MDENIYLTHHGILGQKWGVRRFQNADGSLTNAGKKRYGTGETGANQRKEIAKKVAIGVGVAAAAGIVAYGAIKYSDALKNNDFLKSYGPQYKFLR